MNSTIDARLRLHRRSPLFNSKDLAPISCHQQDIVTLIPHRPPFLLLDQITHVSHQKGCIVGTKKISPKDQYLRGHFPNNPIYPGLLMIEAIGQLALSLYYFMMAKSNYIDEKFSIPSVLLTKLLGAHFLNPIYPNSVVTLLAQSLEYDGMLAQAMGQAIVEDKVSLVMAAEVYIANNE